MPGARTALSATVSITSRKKVGMTIAVSAAQASISEPTILGS